MFLLVNSVQDWYQPSTMNSFISSLLPLKCSFITVYRGNSNFNIILHVLKCVDAWLQFKVIYREVQANGHMK